MELKFNNKTFQEGINLTVRRGTKWETQDADNVNIVARVVMKFSDIKDYDLYHEHDKSCRTVKGLLRAMKNTYSDFDINELVTLVYFEATYRTIKSMHQVY